MMNIIKNNPESDIYFEYKEYFNKENNEYKIVTILKYKTKSKRAFDEIQKSWNKDKSPLLPVLNKIYRRHIQDIKDGKETKSWYDINDIR